MTGIKIMGGSLAELLGAGSGMGEEQDEQTMMDRMMERDEKRANRFSERQAREMLGAAYTVLMAKHKFSSGQFVRYKRGVESSHKKPVGGVAMFISYDLPTFQQEPAARGHPISEYEEDCVVGILLANGAMAEYMTCSRYLEPAPAPPPEETTDEVS